MGRLLSPAGEELGDKIYKHVIGNFNLFYNPRYIFIQSHWRYSLQLKLKTKASKRSSTKLENSSVTRLRWGKTRTFALAQMICIRARKVILLSATARITIIITIAAAQRRKWRLKLKIEINSWELRIVKMVSAKSADQFESHMKNISKAKRPKNELRNLQRYLKVLFRLIVL